MPIIKSLLSALGLQRKARTDSGPIPLSGYTSGSYYDWTSTRGIPSPFSDTTPWHLNPVVAAGIAWFARNFPVPDLHVVRDGGDDDGAEIEDHWLPALFDKPNELWSFFDFFAASVSSDLVDGNTFWLKRKSRGEGKVVDLWWLDPWQVKIVPDPTRAKAVMVYEYVSGDVHERYEPDEIIHIRSAVPDRGDPRRGLSPLAAAERSIRVTNEVARYDEAILKNGGSSPGVFTPADPTQPIPDADISSLQAWYRRNQTGPHAGGPIFAPFGLQFQQTGFSPEQLSLDKLPKRHVSFILGAIGLSPMVLGYEDESKTYANFGEAMRAAYDSLRAMQDRFAEAINHDPNLIVEGERLAWNYTDVPYLQENRGEKIASLVAAVGGGILTVDEARAELHYEPMPEEEKPEPPPEVEPELEEEDQVADLAAVLAGRNGHGANGNGKPTKPVKAITEADLRERADRLLAALEAKLGPSIRKREQKREGEDRDPFPLETAAAVTNIKALHRAGSLSRKSAILALKAVRRGACRDRRGRFAACGGGSATSQDVRPEGATGGTREPRRGRPQAGPPGELKPTGKPKPVLPTAPTPEVQAARRERVKVRMGEIDRRRDTLKAEIARHQVDPLNDTARVIEGKVKARRKAERQLKKADEEHGRLAGFEARQKELPNAVPPGPIADRIKDYAAHGGEAKRQALLEGLKPIEDRHAAAQAGHAKAKAEYDQHVKELAAHEANFHKLRKEGKEPDLTEWDAAGARARAKWGEVEGHADTMKALELERTAVTARVLAVDRPTVLARHTGPGRTVEGVPFRGESTGDMESGLSFTTGITRTGGEPHEVKVGTAPGQRAHFFDDQTRSGSGNYIVADPRTDAATFAHEAGHMVEQRTRTGGEPMGTRSREFLEHRTAGEAPVKMAVVRPGQGFKDDEMGRKDKFDSVWDEGRAYYVGKSYAGASTEIVSMGIEQLHRDAGKLARNDPEYFHLMTGLLGGELR